MLPGGEMIEEELIDYEDKSNVLEFKVRYKNLLIWPFVRDLFMRKIVNKEYNILPATQQPKRENKFRDYIKCNTFNIPKKDILFFWPSMTLVKTENRIYDRIINDLIMSDFNNTLEIITDGTNLNYTELCELDYSVSLDCFLKKLILYEGKRNTLSGSDMEVINEFVDYLQESVPFEVERGVFNGVREHVAKILKEFPAYYKYYEKLMDIVQPKVAIFNCGVYGFPQVKVLNDYGIVTAEYQHGRIDHHFSYMYKKNIGLNEEYKGYMPKYFLSWGDYWTRDTELPAKVYKIGNPIVQKNIENFKKMKKDGNGYTYILLVVTVMHEWYIKFIYYILDSLPQDYRVIVKLHPSLSETKKHYEMFINNERVCIACSGAIYEYFEKCKYVIGDVSTALYEAAAVGKDIFIVDCELARSRVSARFGTWIKDGKEFVEKISIKRKNTFKCDDFFEPNWQENYLKFIEMAKEESKY